MQIATNQNRDLAAESLASCYLLLLQHAQRAKQERKREVTGNQGKAQSQLASGKPEQK